MARRALQTIRIAQSRDAPYRVAAMQPNPDENLQNLAVAVPCRAAWSRMPGTDKVRYCHECNLNVYNLSGMTAREADTLLRSHRGRLCIRLLRRRDGTIVRHGSELGRRRPLRRMLYALAGLLALVGFPSCVVQSLGAIDIEHKPVPAAPPQDSNGTEDDAQANRQNKIAQNFEGGCGTALPPLA